MSADAVKIKSSGDVTNTGTIAGRTLVSINADNINNLGGRISGGDDSQSGEGVALSGGAAERPSMLTECRAAQISALARTT